MIPYHFLHEGSLLARLKEFKAVILPDQRRLPPELVAALGEWVNEGGVLLATASTGTLDESYQDAGCFALEGLLGVRFEGLYDQPHAYIEVTDDRLKPGTLDMPHLAETRFVFARPVADDVQVLARLRRVGQGWAAYIAGEVFHAYQVKNQWNLKQIVANLLNLLVPQRLVEALAPAGLEVALMRQVASEEGGGERVLVHLVNHHGNRPVDRNNYCLEQVLPVRDVRVRLRYASKPNRVTLEPGGRWVEWTYTDGVIDVRVPEVRIPTAIVVG